jgi:hypothetical protein
MTPPFAIAIVAMALALIGPPQSGFAAELPEPLPCSSCFIGPLKLISNPSDATGKTKILADDLFFVDPDKFVWKAGKGDVTDGASIPDLFKPIIGDAFEPNFLPAAVIHDRYTNRAHRVRPWRDTARVFYQAMLVKGVPVVKAKTMYFAVYAFGPHWGVLAKGVPCGKNCIFTTPPQISVTTGGNIVSTGAQVILSEGRVYAEEGADFSDAHANELQEIQRKIESSEIRGTPLSLKELDGLATLSHDDNIFLVNE